MRWTALLRGRRLRLPWRIASGSWQPPRGWRLMSAREREHGELPSPDLSLSDRKVRRGLIVFRGNIDVKLFNGSTDGNEFLSCQSRNQHGAIETLGRRRAVRIHEVEQRVGH